MSARPTFTVAVESPEEIERLEREILSGDLESLEIEAIGDSSALLTAGDVRRLMRASRASGTRITFVTDDPLRHELISILGGDVRGGPEPDSSERPVVTLSSNDDLTRKIGYVRGPARAGNDSTASLDRDEPSFSFVIAPPASQARKELTTRWPMEGDTPATVAPRPRPRRRRRRGGRIVTALLLLATLAAFAGLLALYLLPSAIVTVTPEITDVTTEITYGVAMPGTTWDIPIQPSALDLTLTASATIATTGERFEPNGTATGALQLTNASTSEVFVPAGTAVYSDSGVEFVTSEDIVIPAADPFGTLTFGSATVGIQAVDSGTSGNVSAEEVVGQLDSGVFFTNLEPTTGGSTRRVQTVSQNDMDALQARVSSEINDRVPAELAGKLATGQQILAGSEAREPISYSFNHALESDATELKVEATQRISALAYSIDDVHAVAQERAVDSLAARAGGDVMILADSVQLSAPEPVTGASAPAFVVKASGKAEAVLDSATLNALPELLANESRADAQRIAGEVPGIASVKIESSHSWLPVGMPRHGERIEVIVVQSAGDSAPEAGGTSSGP